MKKGIRRENLISSFAFITPASSKGWGMAITSHIKFFVKPLLSSNFIS